MSERIVALAFVPLPVYVGVLTKSDAFTLFLLTAGPLFVALKLWSWLRLPQRELTVRTAAAGLVLLALPMLPITAIPYAVSATTFAENFAENMYEDNDQGEDRLRLWHEAFSRGMDAGMLGLGPGAHIISGKFKRQPPPNFEAHNTVLDLFTQGGILIVALFFWLVGVGFLVAGRAGHAALATLLFSLVVFGMFHLIVRHPIFWFGIALCLLAGDGNGREVAPGRNYGRV
jgi:hypothetical protein